MIDLGLPSGTKWACCNLGADEPIGFGGYYAWGETSEKSEYLQSNYQLNGIPYAENNTGYAGIFPLPDLQEPEFVIYDAAAVNWGAAWQMPSKAQMEELLKMENYDIQGSRHFGTIYGIVRTSQNGNSIFIPCAGIKDENGIHFSGLYPLTSRNYWTSTGAGERDGRFSAESSAYIMQGWYDHCTYQYLYKGLSIRPVAK